MLLFVYFIKLIKLSLAGFENFFSTSTNIMLKITKPFIHFLSLSEQVLHKKTTVFPPSSNFCSHRNGQVFAFSKHSEQKYFPQN